MSNVDMRTFRRCYFELVRLFAEGIEGNKTVPVDGQKMASGT